jgi:hypothetical protein
MSLLGSCRIYEDVERGKRIGNELLKLNPKIESTYILLANIYSKAGLFDEQQKILDLMDSNGIQKEIGRSYAIYNGIIHEFSANEKNHPEIEEIKKTKDLLRKTFEEWYKKKYLKKFIPDLSYVTNRKFKTYEEKALSLWEHSERYAFVYLLMKLLENERIVITKNLRICGDCHPVIKLFSEMLNREISIRDANCWHNFKDGKCSCKDHF